jgi:hypothetical protein
VENSIDPVPSSGARKQGAMLIAIMGLALSLDGCLSRILMMHADREWN